jgi:transcription antitermination factor NusG
MANGTCYNPAVPKKPERQFHVGQKIRINLHAGRIEEATVKDIVEHTDGLRLQVDFGHEQTALIHVWQVVGD